MARKTVVELVDDIDGGAADETVTFTVDGVTYEVDLSDENAERLRDSFAPYIAAGTRVSGRNKARKSYGGPDRSAVRAWASEHGYTVSDRGRLPEAVLEAYAAAH